jgi:glutamine---fructose-6-phosphate transaminase (isomerizing)
MSVFESEIREQPSALQRLLAGGQGTAEDIARRVLDYDPRFVMIAARGSSDNAARYASYLLGIHNRLPVALAAPSMFTLYDRPPRLNQCLVVGISQSGRSPDLLAVLQEGRRQGALTLAISNDPRSPLAEAAALVFPLEAGEERAVAATKTYTSQLLAVGMLSAALERSAARWDELRAVPAQVQRAIDLNAALGPSAEGFRNQSRLAVVGRGFNLATVFEVALKIKETSYLMAEPYSSADFLHGPVAMVDASLPVLVVAPRSQAPEDLETVLRLVRDRGARLVALSDREDLLESAAVALPLPPGMPEWVSPMVAIVPGQLFSLALAAARGASPDAPRGLSKVTETR